MTQIERTIDCVPKTLNWLTEEEGVDKTVSISSVTKSSTKNGVEVKVVTLNPNRHRHLDFLRMGYWHTIHKGVVYISIVFTSNQFKKILICFSNMFCRQIVKIFNKLFYAIHVYILNKKGS